MYIQNVYVFYYAKFLKFSIFRSIKYFATKMQNVTSGNTTRPKRLDDFKYIEEPEMTRFFLDELAKLRFHGVSVSVIDFPLH